MVKLCGQAKAGNCQNMANGVQRTAGHTFLADGVVCKWDVVQVAGANDKATQDLQRGAVGLDLDLVAGC